MKREKGFMSFGLFRDIIHQAKGNRNQLIILHHFGEPLLHPEMARFINLAERHMRTMISTNAVFLTRNKATEIIHSGLSFITISINGHSSQTYSEITQRDNFDLVRENVISFLQRKYECGNEKPQVNLQIIKMRKTADQIDQFIEFWKAKGADKVHIKYLDTWAGQIESIRELAHPDDRIRSSERERYPCKYLWDNIVVLWDGRAVPCCRDYDGKEILGDLKRQSLKKVWGGPQLRRLRAQHVAGNYSESELCRDCIEWVGYPRGDLYPFDLLSGGTRMPDRNRRMRDVY